MKLEMQTYKRRALRAHVVPVPGGVVLKRGRAELRMIGEGAKALLRTILEASSGAGCTEEDLLARVAPEERTQLGTLIDALVQRRFLVAVEDESAASTEDESPEDVFYWHFGQTRDSAHQRLSELRVVLVGDNRILQRLAGSLGELGCTNLTVVDDAALVDPESMDLLVAASELGDVALIHSWNDFCLLHRRSFFPILLQDLVGQVGPLIIPGETACFNCCRMRRSTHETDPATRRAIEAVTPSVVGTGFLPPMTGILGDLAAMELVKFYALGHPAGQAGVFLDVNLLAGDVTSRPVLRMPRCPSCTPLSERPSLPTTRTSPPGRPPGAP